MHTRRPATLIFILLTVLIDVMGVGLIIPVLPKLILQLSGSLERSAVIFGVIGAVYALMQFVFAPLLGALSDRYGRRPVLLLSLLGVGCDYLFLTFAPSVGWLFVGRVIAGIMGASITVANAYIADVSPPEARAKNFGLLYATFGLGFIVGPLLGGVLGGVHLRLPFAFAAALALLNALYGLFVLPESLPPEKRGQRGGSLNPFLPLMQIGRYPLLRNLTGGFILFGLAQQVIFSTWVLFTGQVLGWGPIKNGVGLAVVGAMNVLVQAVLIAPAVKLLGERRTVVVGLSIAVVEFVLLGLARTDFVMYFSIVVGGLGGVAGPTLQSLLSRSVSEQEQGSMQGVLTGVNSLVGIVGPLLSTWVFAHFASAESSPVGVAVPGAAFFMGALFALAGTLLAAYVLRRGAPGVPPEVAQG